MQKVVQYIERHKLFSWTTRYLWHSAAGRTPWRCCACSSAWDTHAKPPIATSICAERESDRDEHFVRQLCLEHRVTLHTVHFNTEQEKQRNGISPSKWLQGNCATRGSKKQGEACSAAVIAADHQDDSVETLLLNLIRGTGINGLRGIRPRSNRARPLLCLDRKEITGYLESIGQSYVTDSTNLQDEYTRNKIRLNLLPMMQEINPSVKESILKTAEHLDDAASIYNIGIEEAKLRVKTPGRHKYRRPEARSGTGNGLI